jgi:hypothetical protein
VTKVGIASRRSARRLHILTPTPPNARIEIGAIAQLMRIWKQVNLRLRAIDFSYAHLQLRSPILRN